MIFWGKNTSSGGTFDYHFNIVVVNDAPELSVANSFPNTFIFYQPNKVYTGFDLEGE